MRTKTITYAIDREDGLVISRVGDELAWPILDFAGIGQGGNGFAKGDFRGPMNYKLEKIPVYEAGASAHANLRWTKKIPIKIKNRHRRFWGIKPLKAR
jgi:hypothetical protein